MNSSGWNHTGRLLCSLIKTQLRKDCEILESQPRHGADAVCGRRILLGKNVRQSLCMSRYRIIGMVIYENPPTFPYSV